MQPPYFQPAAKEIRRLHWRLPSKPLPFQLPKFAILGTTTFYAYNSSNHLSWRCSCLLDPAGRSTVDGQVQHMGWLAVHWPSVRRYRVSAGDHGCQQAYSRGWQVWAACRVRRGGTGERTISHAHKRVHMRPHTRARVHIHTRERTHRLICKHTDD